MTPWLFSNKVMTYMTLHITAIKAYDENQMNSINNNLILRDSNARSPRAQIVLVCLHKVPTLSITLFYRSISLQHNSFFQHLNKCQSVTIKMRRTW